MGALSGEATNGHPPVQIDKTATCVDENRQTDVSSNEKKKIFDSWRWTLIRIGIFSANFIYGLDTTIAAAIQAEAANDPNTAFDDHNYIGFALGGSSDQAALMKSACTDSRLVSGQNVTITGEWSMTSGVAASDTAFFTRWFTAQQQLYEKPGMAGWVFWTWKTDLNDPRWTYSVAADQGLIPTTASDLEQNVFQQVC
ncbi:hypothetical protein NQ176_g2391 [Zarea fungicola]|uniref:Uncharacterized protein n=1 Tax=Zarea fungicola TaxID=93591 RepID=A0ACC1NQH0_9HYPO|nr:hypothetical protein NQ176_g2391 [Lecanicillium fungicola]